MLKSSVVKKFEDIVGKKNCFTNSEDVCCYSYDAFSGEYVAPEIVVKPEAECQVSEIIKLCKEESIPLVTRGAGSNLSGGTVPLKGGCVLVTTSLNKIIEINIDDMYAVVQSGVVTAKLANTVQKEGLFYPPDPGSMNISTIGGNVAENAGGLRGLKYGVTKDYLMGVKFFDADGNLIKGGGRTVKLVTGFNLPGLMVGSEGTLGVMTEFILKLIPKPKFNRSMIVTYNDIIKACDTVSMIIRDRILPATMELMDNFTIKTVEEATKIGLPVDAEALLLVEVDGFSKEVEEQFERIKIICEKMDGKVIAATSQEEKERLWEARRKALSCLARLKPTVILEDATVPRSKISEMMKVLKEVSLKYHLTIGTFGHAGDGNLHPTILTDKRDKEEMVRVEKAIDEIFAKTLALGGTLSGEHGIGYAKAKYMEMEVGSSTINYMKKLKSGIDPKNILNPHKMGL